MKRRDLLWNKQIENGEAWLRRLFLSKIAKQFWQASLAFACDTLCWTGAEIEATCRRAGLNAIRRNYKETDAKKVKITKEDFDKAIIEISKTIDKPLKEELKKRK